MIKSFIYNKIFKNLLVIINPFINPNNLIKAGLYLKFISWSKNLDKSVNVAHRLKIDEYINSYINNEPIDYLEFGVASGNSFKYWLELNTNPSSRFYGFDTFHGIPEEWQGYKIGSFSNEGNVPDIKDHRSKFIKGLFQDTLKTFLENYKPQNRLIICLDADLYSSTLYVLMTLNHLFDQNTIIIFDEFLILNHEFRAFLDYKKATGRNLEVLAHNEKFDRTVFKVIS